MKKISSESFQLLPHMVPHVRISPFIPQELEKVSQSKNLKALKTISRPDSWLSQARDIQFYNSGRQSLLACLKHLQLKSDDEVLIVKNTNGAYISGCITKTIEQVCHWSQVFSSKTRLVMVIHEFGFPCPEEKFLHFRKKGLPILEDCAYSFGSRLEGAKVGVWGDYAIYSMTKYYPLPLGGFLVAKSKLGQPAKELCVSATDKKLILHTMAKAQPFTSNWNKSRRENWRFFAKQIAEPGFKPYFVMDKSVVPGAYVTKVPADFPGEQIKERLNNAGVEATQYYHQGGFYFPVHQFLTEYEKKYILHNLPRQDISL